MIRTAATQSGQAAYQMAGLAPRDIDTAQLYDCFTYMALVQLEDYGFCKKGDGGPFAASGALALDGELPCNTSGGQLSEGHVEGMLQIVEAVRQLRHEHAVRPASAQCQRRAGQWARRKHGLPFDADPREARHMSALSEDFRKACAAGELRMQQCADCGTWRFPPGERCPGCLSPRWAWTQTSGRGKVQSFVVFHRAYHPAFASALPYVVALIELEEGVRMISNIVDCPIERVCCDMPVKVCFEPAGTTGAGDDSTVMLPKFRVVTSRAIGGHCP